MSTQEWAQTIQIQTDEGRVAPVPKRVSGSHYVVHLHGERVRGLSNLPDAKVQDTSDGPRLRFPLMRHQAAVGDV